MKTQAYTLQLYWKRDSQKGVSLSILQKLSEELFNRIPQGDTDKAMTLVVQITWAESI